MVRHRPLPGIFSAHEGVEPAYRAEPIDEYRDLAMLADAWEHGSLGPGLVGDWGGHFMLATRSNPDGREDDQCDRRPLGRR